MEEELNENTTFVRRFGMYQFEVMSFSLRKAPSFHRLMEDLFKDFSSVRRTSKYARRAYLDDLVVF